MEKISLRSFAIISIQLLRKDNKDTLAQLLQTTDTVEIFWFPFNSIFNDLLRLENKMATLKIDEKELASGKIVRLANNRDSPWWWDPWNDDLWSREIDFTDDSVTKE